MIPRLLAACLALPITFACRATDVGAAGPTASNAGGAASTNDAAAGLTQNAQLRQICIDGWALSLASDPIQATYLGDQRFYGELVLPSPESRTAEAERLGELLDRLEQLDRASLAPDERVTAEFLRELFDTRRAALLQRVDEPSWNLDPRSGPQVDFASLALMQPCATARERELLLERWRKIPAYVDQCAANIARGVAAGRVASHTTVERVLGQLDELLATPIERSPLSEPARRELSGAPDLAAWRTQVREVVERELYPAFERYRETLRTSVAPNARSDERPGIVHVDGGIEAYIAAIRRHTSLELPAQEIHAFGVAEIARIRSEIAALGERVFGTRDVAQIQTRLRSDAQLHFSTRDEIESKARAALAKAQAAEAQAFGIRPRAKCEVVRVPQHEERDTTIAYYREPAPDGSRPGRYYINTFEPHTRPRYDAEALAFHEAVPGHHLQTAIAQELTGLPLLRRHHGFNAYVEGWALYTERLCDELGLYTADLDRLGMLSFDAWRAARLVVDTGIHAFGWSRERAIAYLRDNTLLAESNVINEVDRYIAWPGQALGYKLGSREMFRLRELARERLGERFSLSAFHDAVLRQGPLPLPLLRAEIERWLDQTTRVR